MKKYIIIASIIGGTFIGLSYAQADSLGQGVLFRVDSGYDIQTRSEIQATLRQIGEHVYFYVEDDYWKALSPSAEAVLKKRLVELATEFDNVIYPKERQFFGSEWNPGIDNDSRITILVSRLVDDAGGYIRTYDEYDQAMVESSNQREMFYINTSFINDPRMKSFIAHEFQHLITFYQKTILYGIEEEVWLNEARSEYAPTLLGYDDVYVGSNLAERVNIFLESPKDSVTEWKNKIADYSSVSLFLHYLVDHYSNDVLLKMLSNDSVGIASVNQALSGLGYDKEFSDIFSDWVITNYLNDCNVSFGQYCYKNDDLNKQRISVGPTVSYSGFPDLVIDRSGTTKDWSSIWYRFRPQPNVASDKDTLKLEFKGSEIGGDFRVPYIISGETGIEVNTIALENQAGQILIPNFISQGKTVIISPFNQFKKAGFLSNEQVTSYSFTATSIAQASVQVSSLSPSLGPVSGGTKVKIRGAEFVAGTQVKFGDLAATSVNVISADEIEVFAPAHVAGRVAVTVTLPDLSSATINGFTYEEKVINTSYPEGSLLRAKGDFKVYVIKGNYKRWIQTAAIFNAYGHLRWADIIDVEPEDLNQYQESSLIRAVSAKPVYVVSSTGIKRWLNMSAASFAANGYVWDMVFEVNSFEKDYYSSAGDITS